ncbi:DUF3099 domain-containing protein [Gordonia sp. (in: high G+C Gram-positive bacteria)]|uniref:DUF3099 domain-containing protein n=1 Tax=Gordonia sp. (in: high G+C Gram-positive bacteria) TaxID=84139 RepID=UPI001694C6DC|nr:DUF3099 domain-containing protein [Gordonia sp. (in: high G+C Gram-positive bacteria)]NLG48158.1 DUF3099 domain-containing protein [Gordonia sp. (in: high G+C Gram-positive bacteria)]
MDERQGHDRNVDTYLITSAEPDRDAVFAARKRRYFIMMSIRIPALIIASIVYGTTQNAWWAVGIILISIPIPWIAVLKANDREPRKHGEVPTYHYGSSHSAQPLLTSEPESHPSNRYADDRNHPVIDVEHDDQDDSGSAGGRA